MATAEISPVTKLNLKLRDYSRFRGQKIYRYPDGRLYFGTFSKPSFPESARDVHHTVVEGQELRLDLIAYSYYRTPELWWVIALVNDIVSPFDEIEVGDVLRIPNISTVISVLG